MRACRPESRLQLRADAGEAGDTPLTHSCLSVTPPCQLTATWEEGQGRLSRLKPSKRRLDLHSILGVGVGVGSPSQGLGPESQLSGVASLGHCQRCDQSSPRVLGQGRGNHLKVWEKTQKTNRPKEMKKKKNTHQKTKTKTKSHDAFRVGRHASPRTDPKL